MWQHAIDLGRLDFVRTILGISIDFVDANSVAVVLNAVTI